MWVLVTPPPPVPTFALNCGGRDGRGGGLHVGLGGLWARVREACGVTRVDTDAFYNGAINVIAWAHVHAHFPLRWPQLLADRRVLSHAQRGAPAGAGHPRAVGSLGRRSTRSVHQRLATRAGPRAGGGAIGIASWREGLGPSV